MKMINALVFAALMGLGFVAQASEDHTPNICTQDNEQLCLHVGFHDGVPAVSSEAQFMVHFMVGPDIDAALIANVQVELWMPDMGHGSSPVAVEQLDAVHFHVSQAYFIMPGTWEIRVNFTYNGEAKAIYVPVTIE